MAQLLVLITTLQPFVVTDPLSSWAAAKLVMWQFRRELAVDAVVRGVTLLRCPFGVRSGRLAVLFEHGRDGLGIRSPEPKVAVRLMIREFESVVVGRVHTIFAN